MYFVFSSDIGFPCSHLFSFFFSIKTYLCPLPDCLSIQYLRHICRLLFKYRTWGISFWSWISWVFNRLTLQFLGPAILLPEQPVSLLHSALLLEHLGEAVCQSVVGTAAGIITVAWDHLGYKVSFLLFSRSDSMWMDKAVP
jgi:hypothetical protein